MSAPYQPLPPSGKQPMRFEKRPPKPTVNPKRVVGGIRLANKEGFTLPGAPVEQADPAAPAASDPAGAIGTATNGWVAQRWVRLIESCAAATALAEGLDYARSGQTRTLDIKPGLLSARVQGRLPTAYTVNIRFPMFTHMQWEQVTGSMVNQARFAAAILAGQLPANIEDLFAPVGLRLFPTEPSDAAVSCTCADFAGKPASVVGLAAISQQSGLSAEPDAEPPVPAPVKRPSPDDVPPSPWCKHACCVMYLVGEKLSREPMLVFSLRGLPEQDLLERLRQHRALAGMARAGAGPTPVYLPHLPGLGDRPDKPLEECLHEFWIGAGSGSSDGAVASLLADLDVSITRPEVTHPLLRRLGPSPFAGAKFPLVGLLATCYELIGDAALRGQTAGPEGGAEAVQDCGVEPDDPDQPV